MKNIHYSLLPEHIFNVKNAALLPVIEITV